MGSPATASIAGRKVALLKPQTYMNDSGRSVGEAMRYLKIARERRRRLPRRARPRARQDQGQDRRRQRRPQRPALDQRPHRQRVRARAHRHRPSGLQGAGARLRAARLRQGRRGLAASRCSMRSPKRAGRLAAGDAARFLTDVARGQRGNDEPLPQAAPRPAAAKKEPAHAGGRPSGRRAPGQAGGRARRQSQAVADGPPKRELILIPWASNAASWACRTSASPPSSTR